MAASKAVGSLHVNLGLDSAKFSKGMKGVSKEVRLARTHFLAIAGAAAAMGAAIVAAAMKGGKEIDRLAKAGKRLDTSVAGMRALELVAGEAGVALSSLTKDMQTLDREVARGGKKATEALKKLNLEAKDLAGLEADQKLGLLSDAVKDVGLSTGEATALLQDLGIRNREMVLALMAGGKAFKDARRDIEDYGLAVSEVDASAIEKANDQIARIGLVTQYIGQQLAITLLPALGRMAEMFTDAMRAGEPLRQTIDFLITNLDTIASSVGVLVVAAGVKLVAAMAAAAGATGLLSGAFVVLKGAIFATGFGAIIIGAGYVIAKFIELTKKTGGWAEALDLLGEVAEGVWDGIVVSAGAIPPGLQSVWEAVKSGFLGMIASLMAAWSDFLFVLSDGANKLKIPGTEDWGLNLLSKAATHATGVVDRYTISAQGAAEESKRLAKVSGGIVVEGFEKSKEAVKKLSRVMGSTAVDTDRMKAALLKAKDEAKVLETGLGGGGGGGGGAAGAVKDFADEIQRLEFDADPIAKYNHEVMKLVNLLEHGLSENALQNAIAKLNEELEKTKPELGTIEKAFDSFKASASSAFEGLITGAKSFKDALADVLRSLASVFAQAAASSIFDKIKLPGFATGTPYAPGGLSLVGERGPELVNLPKGSRVHTAGATGRMGGGGDTFAPVYNIDARGADVGAVQRLEQAMQQANAEFESRAVNAVNVGRKRRQIV